MEPTTSSAPEPGDSRHELLDDPDLGISAVVDGASQPGIARVVLSGELDPLSSPSLARLLYTLIDDGVGTIYVDVSGLDPHQSSAGLRMLEHARRTLEARQGTLHIIDRPEG